MQDRPIADQNLTCSVVRTREASPSPPLDRREQHDVTVGVEQVQWEDAVGAFRQQRPSHDAHSSARGHRSGRTTIDLDLHGTRTTCHSGGRRIEGIPVDDGSRHHWDVMRCVDVLTHRQPHGLRQVHGDWWNGLHEAAQVVAMIDD